MRKPTLLVLMCAASCGTAVDPSSEPLAQHDDSLVLKGCFSDADCWKGAVCEFCNKGYGQCVDGCRKDDQCGAGEICEAVVCVTCPCPARCTAKPQVVADSVPTPACRDDADCASGTVCESCLADRSDAKCVPGCRYDTQCKPGSTSVARCQKVECVACPCPAQCQ